MEHSNDPELYTYRTPCGDVPTEILQESYEIARGTYYTCGGHQRAARMESAMTNIAAELLTRGIEPVVSGSKVTGWQPVS